MDVRLKKITIKDAAAITSLIGQLGYESSITDTAQRIKSILPDPQHFAVVAEVDNKIVGWIHAFITVHLQSNSFAEIGGMVVEENFRGKGIGKKLIDEAEKWAIKQNINKLRVRSNTIRKDAHQFYLNRGFALTKEQKIFDKQIN